MMIVVTSNRRRENKKLIHDVNCVVYFNTLLCFFHLLQKHLNPLLFMLGHTHTWSIHTHVEISKRRYTFWFPLLFRQKSDWM